jgi:hypothetical protein
MDGSLRNKFNHPKVGYWIDSHTFIRGSEHIMRLPQRRRPGPSSLERRKIYFFRPFSKSSHDLVPMASQILNKIAATSNATKAPAPVPYAPTKGTKQKIESWEDFLEIGQNTMKDLAAMGPIAVNMLDTNRKIIEKLRGLPPAATI